MLLRESMRDLVLPFLVVHAVATTAFMLVAALGLAFAVDVPFGAGAMNDEPR